MARVARPLLAPLLALLAAALSATVAADEAPAVYKAGAKVEDAALQDLDGKEVTLASLRGKVVLLNFFSSRCAVCNKEAPRLEKELWPRYRDRGVAFVGIARTPLEGQKMREKHGLTYALWVDREAVLFDRFVDQAVPWNAVIDRDGTIKYTKLGFEEKEIVETLDALLAPKGS